MPSLYYKDPIDLLTIWKAAAKLVVPLSVLSQSLFLIAKTSSY
jgi:hypothetical protein